MELMHALDIPSDLELMERFIFYHTLFLVGLEGGKRGVWSFVTGGNFQERNE